MSVQKKCPNCGTWNGNSDHCTSCNHVLNYWKKREIDAEKAEKDWEARTPDLLDKIFDGMRDSRWLLVRWFYYVLYGIWSVLFAIATFIIAMIAGGPG